MVKKQTNKQKKKTITKTPKHYWFITRSVHFKDNLMMFSMYFCYWLYCNWKEGNVLFNNALNTCYLRLYGVRHMVKTTQIVREETHCRHIDYSFWLAARVLLYALSHRQDNTWPLLHQSWSTGSMGPPHEGSIQLETCS